MALRHPFLRSYDAALETVASATYIPARTSLGDNKRTWFGPSHSSGSRSLSRLVCSVLLLVEESKGSQVLDLSDSSLD